MNATSAETGGPIGYMVRDGVAANLLMALIVAMGLVGLTGVVQEAFPVLPLDAVEVLVAYPGGAPEDVEQSIVLAIKEAVAGLGPVQDVTAVAAEGAASVIVKLKAGTDAERALSDIEAAVDGIRSLRARAERPEVREMTSRQSAIRRAGADVAAAIPATWRRGASKLGSPQCASGLSERT